MSIADVGIFVGFLLVALLLGWVSIRHLARHDQDPEEESRWPEWWEESPSDPGGLRATQANSILDTIRHLPTGSAGVPWLAPEPAGA